MSHTFQILGLQRSGTNFLEQLLKENCAHKPIIANTWRRENHIWKHAYDVDPEDLKIAQKNNAGLYRPENARQQTDATRPPVGTKLLDLNNKAVKEKHYLWIHKHPYSWLESITNKSVDIASTYKWVVAHQSERDNQYAFKTNKHNYLNTVRLCELYREHTLYWFSVFRRKPDLNFKRISYEELIRSKDDTVRHLNEISKQFECRMKESEFQIPDRVSQSDQFNETRRDKYTNIEIRKFSFEQIKKYNEVLTVPVFRMLGYKMITTEEEYMRHKVAP